MKLQDLFCENDGLLIACPEYNQGIPGVLKNAVDWLSRPPRPQPFDGKPVGIIGAIPGRLGTRAAQYQLRQVLTGLNAFVMPQPAVFVGDVGGKLDEQGRLNDESTEKVLARFMSALAGWIRRFV